ncbi:hypothetical protein D9758_000092 [Tetrapyrgos nigripes]|uniref:ATP-dependent DNA helicase PIF1 n=1 Tax=Tetrapyrgos nigripes TaxID=182062 RepID=A0A8H5LZH5_9AGAR|nr:hypothetical protein D9758_000092 [Tetrapyrgos nigripes]
MASMQSRPISRPQPEIIHIHDSDSEVECLAGPAAVKLDNDSDIEILDDPSITSQPLPTTTSHPVAGPSRPIPTKSPSISTTSAPRPPSPVDNTSTAPPPEIKLSPEQNHVLERVRNGRSVFFTGSAGTGKSVLLREIIKLKGSSASSSLAITASTGIAAVNIGGTTLHSWAGIGIGEEDPKKFVGKLRGQPKMRKVWERWLNVRTLIIDEISMLDGVLFDKLEEIARSVRNSKEPFGGIQDWQLVLSGDFSQLPPVPNRNSKIEPTFAFQARSWIRCVGRAVMLSKVFRQKDQDFVDMLNDLRFGIVTDHALRTFQGLSQPRHYSDGIEPTELYSTRYEVDKANTFRLDALPDQARTFYGMDLPGQDANGRPVGQDAMNRLLERLIVPRSITLKNLQQGSLVNGSVGQVIRFSTAADALKEGVQIGGSEQNGGERNQRPEDDPAVKQNVQNGREWPVVRFINKKEVLFIPLDFTVDNAEGKVEAKRTQIPLILAWSLSIHKSQGQTLERVKVNLGKVFEKGQAYVALSRATSLSGLQVLHFDASKVRAHQTVLDWYKNNAAAEDEDMDEVDDFADDERIINEMDDEEAMMAYHDGF